MTKAERIKGNKLIAEFLGYELEETPKHQWVYAIPDGNNNTEFYCPRELHYHSSWNWLMPVVRRIIEICALDERAFGSDQYSSILDITPLVIKENSWMVVVEFITWYNTKN